MWIWEYLHTINPSHSQSHWRGETVKWQLINYLLVCVLVTFLLLWENTMTKSTYKRKSLFELNGFRGVGVHHNRGTWKQTSDMAAGAGSQELTFWTICTKQREWKRSGSRFLTSKPTPSDILPPARLHYLNPPPMPSARDPSIQMFEIKGNISHSNGHIMYS